jgi:hypothetical protein
MHGWSCKLLCNALGEISPNRFEGKLSFKKCCYVNNTIIFVFGLDISSGPAIIDLLHPL